MKRIASLLILSLALAGSAYAGPTVVIINNNNNANSDATSLLPLSFVSSMPYDRQLLEKSPKLVKMIFSQPVRADRSTIRVMNAFGQVLNTEPLEMQGDRTLVAKLPELSRGKYSVKWRARCQCAGDDELSDTFRFTVR